MGKVPPDQGQRRMSVYFCRVGRYIKIGNSCNPWKRARSYFYGAGHPHDIDWSQPMEMLGIVYGERDEEQEIHAALADHCMHGEWFADCEAVRDFIRTFDDSPEANAQTLARRWKRWTIEEARGIIDRRRAESLLDNAAYGHTDPPLSDIDARPAEPCEAHADARTWMGAEKYDVRRAELRAAINRAESMFSDPRPLAARTPHPVPSPANGSLRAG